MREETTEISIANTQKQWGGPDKELLSRAHLFEVMHEQGIQWNEKHLTETKWQRGDNMWLDKQRVGCDKIVM